MAEPMEGGCACGKARLAAVNGWLIGNGPLNIEAIGLFAG